MARCIYWLSALRGKATLDLQVRGGKTNTQRTGGSRDVIAWHNDIIGPDNQLRYIVW